MTAEGPGSRISHPSRDRDIAERAPRVQVQPVRCAVEAHEEIEIAILIDIGKGIGQRPAGREQLRLYGHKAGARRLRRQRPREAGEHDDGSDREYCSLHPCSAPSQ